MISVTPSARAAVRTSNSCSGRARPRRRPQPPTHESKHGRAGASALELEVGDPAFSGGGLGPGWPRTQVLEAGADLQDAPVSRSAGSPANQVESLFGHVRQNHRHAEFGRMPRQGLSDARAGAGDTGDIAGQSVLRGGYCVVYAVVVSDPAEERPPEIVSVRWAYCCRMSRLSGLPLGFFGSALTKAKALGTLNAASRPRA
jgi:hypothetical protein